MKLILLISACFFANIVAKNDCTLGKKSLNSKLICYYGDVEDVDGCYCTHVILPPNVDVKSIGKMRQASRGAKIYVTVHEFNQGLIDILKSNKIDGLEISLKKLDSKNDISDFISTVKTKIGTDLDIAVSVPSKSDLVAKYFDFKALSKYADLFILQTAFLGASANVTFHPSRLSGMWDMQNTDSVVDLISGLGAPLSKIVIAAPVQGFQFTLQSEEYTAPGSPALELKSITRDELCKLMQSGKNWTLERDEDQAGPYIFRKNQWLAFEDVKSMDIKAKYSRVRGLAGIALKDLAQDGGAGCGTTILEATYNGLSRQARAPRGAVLHSLEREILESPSKSLDSVQLSPYRISRIIDTEGKIHVTRQDSRTEFQCSRQGYFVHPRSCNRFYRCVKFDQRSEEFNVFEFDCPAGLAFDERVEVCVWPGSLPHGTPCSGSSEIAPVPRKRFECPSEPGYYADPENCRWFFACLDHGKSPLSAYEFRCPFGLGFDSERLVCEWPWLVPKCAGSFGSSLDSEYYYGGASGYAGKGGLSTGLVLQSYDGLGTLGSVKLGGVSGKIEKPIATVFSNVDTGALGLGYQNNGGYIVGGGLSYKAVQSLGNAGLLKVNNGAGYQATGQDQQGFTNIQQTGSFLAGQQAGQSVSQYSEHGADSSSYSFNSNANHNYGQVSSTHSAETSDNSQFQEIKSGYAQASGQQYNSQYQGNQEAAGAVSTQSFTLHHGHQTRDKSQGQNVNAIDGAEQNFFVANGAQENNGYIASNGHIDHESDHGGSYVYQSSSGYGETGHSNQQQGELVVSTGHGDQSSSGAISSHSFAQYGGERQLGGSYQYNSDNGEGYQGDSGSYVNGKTDFSSDQTNVDSKYEGNYQGSTGGTVSSQSFTQYHGKQALSGATYKSGIGGNINIVGGGYSAVGAVNGVDVSNNGDAEDIKTVSYTSTASPVSVITYAPISTGSSVPTVQAVPVPGIKTGGAFETYKGGVIANVPELQYNIQSHGDTGFLANISSRFANFVVTTPETVSQSYSQEGGYVYNKPEQEGSINTVSTAGPFVSVTTQRPQVYFSSSVGPTDAPVSFSTVRPIQSTVTYEKSQNFEQNVGGAVVNTFSTISTANPPKFVSHQQPLIYMSSTPAPPAVSSYSFTQDVGQQQGGYYYNKPDVEYEEGPKNPTIVSKFTIRRPSAHTVNTGSYYYERPTAHIKQNTLVESYAYQQPTVVPQYHYQQPPLEQKPIVPLYKQPQLLSTYTYQPPVRKTAYKQPVSVYTYQNVAQQSLGLNQEKNQVTLVRKPVQKNSYRPSGGTSYQYVKFENDVRGKTAAVQREGYKYPQPTIAFEEVPQKDVLLVLSTPKPNLVIQEIKAQQGYIYQQPAVNIQETYGEYSTPKSVVPVQPAVVTSYFNSGVKSAAGQNNEFKYSNQEENKSQEGYVYENKAVYSSTAKPTVNAQPAVVTSYFNTGSTNFKAESAAQQQNEYEFSRQEESKGQNGYVYENTAVYSTAKPVVNAQPAVVTSYFNTGSTNFKAESAAQQHSEFKFSNQEENNVQQGYVFENPTAKPIENAQPAVVTSYFNLGSTKSQEQAAVDQYKVGYSYPKPSIKFEEAPVTYRTPAVVTNYFNIQSSTPKPDVYAEEEITLSTRKPVSVGYTYPKPQIRFEETSQADILREEQGHVHYTPQTEVAEEPRPAVVTSYFRPKSSNSPSAKGYDYPKPSIQFAEEPQSFVGGYEHQEPVEEEPFVKKTAYITGEYEQNARKNYNYQKTASGSGRVVEDYVYPNYEKVKQAVFGQKLGYEQQQVNYQQSTPRPTFVSTVKSIVAEKTNQISPAVVTFYDSRLTSTPESYIVSSTASPEIHTVSTSRPISRFSFSSADDQNQYNQNFDIIRSTTYESTKKYLSPTSRVRVTTALPKLTRTKVVEDYVAPEVTTLARDYLPSRIRTKAPPREYLPVEVTTPSRAYIPSRQRVRVTSSTAAPEVTTLEREYLPVEITTPSRAYIPSRQRVRVTSSTAAPEVTSLEREYLPVEITTPSRAYIPSRQRVRVTTTTGAPEITTLEREYLPVKITSTDSSYIIKKPAAVRVGRPVKVIKQNDAHPLLSAKLGAQCTCVSNTLKLRKNQRIIIVEDEENNDDDDGYIIDNENQGKVIENYKYEPQKVVDITPVPDYYVKSTSVVPQSYIRRRVKVRPVQPVTEAVEIFYNKNTSPAAFQDESAPSDREIAKAVRTGLKLVKQAAKEGAQEALSGRQFDRYGPGGVRSKSETLQGTIDCQRAGLFRHPTECNKFYACRWDCTKNRFTLHVFNCPVHLTFDNNLGACNWPSQGPACIENTLITSD